MKTLIGFFVLAAVSVFTLPFPAAAQDEASDYATLFAACRASGGTAAGSVDEWLRQHGCLCPHGPSGADNVTCEQDSVAKGEDSDLQQESVRAISKGIVYGDANLTMMGIGGLFLNGILNSNPEEDRAEAEAEARAKADAEWRAIQAARAAEARRQKALNDSKDRIQHMLKDADAPVGVPSIKHDDDLVVASTSAVFNSTAIVPADALMVGSLRIKTDDGAAAPSGGLTISGIRIKTDDSGTAREGFDGKGRLMGAASFTPGEPAHSNLEPAPIVLNHEQRLAIMGALKNDLKAYDAAEQPLKAKLTELQKAPTPDPEAINKVQAQIAVREEGKKEAQKKLDLTASDDEAAQAAPAAAAAPPPKAQP